MIMKVINLKISKYSIDFSTYKEFMKCTYQKQINKTFFLLVHTFINWKVKYRDLLKRIRKKKRYFESTIIFFQRTFIVLKPILIEKYVMVCVHWAYGLNGLHKISKSGYNSQLLYASMENISSINKQWLYSWFVLF